MGKVGKILLAVVTVAAIIALTIFAPEISALLLTVGVTAAPAMVIAIGSVIISLASSLIGAAIAGGQRNRMELAKVNVRLEAPERWINAGRVLQGGGVLFGEFDAAGNFWYVIVHCDSILTGAPTVFLDNIEVTLNGSNEVTHPDFIDKKGRRYFSVWTYTHSETDPVPTGAAQLAAAFPSKWTLADHLLAGTTYSVIKCAPIKIDDRSQIYRWRGPIGLGEPNVAILGQWSNMYDPRDETQTLGDRSTYKPSSNSALIWAWWRTHPYGMKKSESEINWTKVAEQADICDQSVVGTESTQPRYECAIAAQDRVDRGGIQSQIMLSCDGQLVFDDDGKTWMRVGHFYTPTLSLSRNRDIIAMETVEAQDGESETQGVVVRYIDPLSQYTLQPSAPWLNPNYYRPGEGNRFLTIDIPTISNHNQAMRVAKGLGMRSQPIQKVAPTVGLRGVRAMQERIININYDNTFSGDYEIITPVEVDESGVFCSIGAVPVDSDRWRLLPGEEKPRPNSEFAGEVLVLTEPSGVTIDYNNGRIEANFDEVDRVDVRYEFQYIMQSEWADTSADRWASMSVDMETTFAYSGPVDQSVPQLVRWRAISTGGSVTDWSDPPYLVNAVEGPVSQAIYNSFILQVTNGIVIVTIDADGTLTIDDHTRRYTDGYPDTAVDGDIIDTGLVAGDERAIAYDDQFRAGGAVTYNLYESDSLARVSSTNLYRHYVGYFVVPTTGTGGGGGGGAGGGGGFCVTDDTRILMANYDQSDRGIEKVANDLKVGDWVWTKHEITMEWGAYQISALSFINEPVYQADGYPRATAAHRFWIDGWVTMDQIGEPAGIARVVKITVEDAHTYISAGILSHNVKEGETP